MSKVTTVKVEDIVNLLHRLNYLKSRTTNIVKKAELDEMMKELFQLKRELETKQTLPGT